MIKVTFECADVGEVLALLFKIHGTAVAGSPTVIDVPTVIDGNVVKPNRFADMKEDLPFTPEVATPEAKRRPGRPRKGKPSPQSPSQGAAVTPAAQEPQAPAAAVPNVAAPAAPASVPAAAAPSTASMDDALTALDMVVSKRGMQMARKLLEDFGLQRLRDIPQDKIGAFVVKCHDTLNAPPAAA